jgi:isopenicillin N synthase-like dioxygenase
MQASLEVSAMAEAARSIPIIDVGPLYHASASGAAGVAAAIGRACREIGFFYAAGHAVPPAVLADSFAIAKKLFALPAAQKMGVSIKRSPHNRGYVGLQGEALDPSKPPDLKEAFNIGLDLAPDDPEVVAGRPFRGVNLWPELDGFRATMLSYYDAVWTLGRRLHRAFALDLGLPDSYFEDKLDRPMAILRLLHYPPMPTTTAAGQLGAGEHTDYGNLTLLATDASGGLEVRTRRGDWIAAPVIAGAFVCNIGDCLMRWTNDVYVSTPHRVVSPPGLERYSIAFFLDPNPDTVVAVLPGCRGAGGSERYAPIVAADFLRSRLDPAYASSVPLN